MENITVQATIEECLADKVNPDLFRYHLRSALTSVITYKRGNAPDEVEILNSAESIGSIEDEYRSKYALLKTP